MQTLFEKPTVAELAREVLETRQLQTEVSDKIVQTSGERYQFPVSYNQQGIWLLHHLHEKNTLFNIPLIFCIRGLLQVEILHKAFNTIIHWKPMRTRMFHLNGWWKKWPRIVIQAAIPSFRYCLFCKTPPCLT